MDVSALVLVLSFFDLSVSCLLGYFRIGDVELKMFFSLEIGDSEFYGAILQFAAFYCNFLEGELFDLLMFLEFLG